MNSEELVAFNSLRQRESSISMYSVPKRKCDCLSYLPVDIDSSIRELFLDSPHIVLDKEYGICLFWTHPLPEIGLRIGEYTFHP